MEPRLIEAHPWIESTRGCVAIERGLLVYCLEQADHLDTKIADLEIDTTAPLESAWVSGRLEGITVVRGSVGRSTPRSGRTASIARSVAARRRPAGARRSWPSRITLGEPGPGRDARLDFRKARLLPRSAALASRRGFEERRRH